MNVFELIYDEIYEKLKEIKNNYSKETCAYRKGLNTCIGILNNVKKESNCTNDCTHFDNAVQYGYNKAIERLEKFCEEGCFGICPECEVQSAIKHLKEYSKMKDEITLKEAFEKVLDVGIAKEV